MELPRTAVFLKTIDIDRNCPIPIAIKQGFSAPSKTPDRCSPSYLRDAVRPHEKRYPPLFAAEHMFAQDPVLEASRA